MNKLAVIALGGNALLRSQQEGSIVQQEANTHDTIENLVFLIREGYHIVITHGNGPQVGNILMRNAAGEERYGIPAMPLDICVADSQGGIGYMIERALRNTLRQHGLHRDVLTLVTQVLVDKNDAAFRNPQKRVGRIYTKTEAEALQHEKGWLFRPTDKAVDGWRRVVPSPKPVQIFNRNTIEQIARQGVIVIAAGGGGIPVYTDHCGELQGAEAVIDKDAASALLAASIGANELYILTDVPFVYANFRKPTQRVVEFLDHADTTEMLRSGQFSEGTMEPKIRAALSFIEQGGHKSIITDAAQLADKRYGTKITMHYESTDLHKYDTTTPIYKQPE